VLNEAAVGRGHRSPHDAAARRSGAGAGGVYALLEGRPGADALAAGRQAVWIEHAPEGPAQMRREGMAELLADGIDPASASLWRRQLVLGPAPEYCVIAVELPSGVRPGRLPEGWTARVLAREAVYGG